MVCSLVLIESIVVTSFVQYMSTDMFDQNDAMRYKMRYYVKNDHGIKTTHVYASIEVIYSQFISIEFTNIINDIFDDTAPKCELHS